MTGRRLIECLRALSPEELELPVRLTADDTSDRLRRVHVVGAGDDKLIELTVD